MDGQIATWLMVLSALIVVLTLPDGRMRPPRRTHYERRES